MQPFVITLNKVNDNLDFVWSNSKQDYWDEINRIIESDPFQGKPFYIFSVLKRLNDATGTKKFFHQPRLTKPFPVPGTHLTKVDPLRPGTMEMRWALPVVEAFGLYKYKRAFGDQYVYECVQMYKNNPGAMCKPEPGDLSDEEIKEVYKSVLAARSSSEASSAPSA